MAELYPPSYASRQAYHRHTDPVSPHQQQQQYSSLNGGTGLVYPSQILPSAHSSSNGTQEETPEQPHTPPKAHEPQTPAKSESKPQATFLTKLYALLERPENHHMIRWDQAGEHIIVERPEQLALHVLPSIYRQSRFASFSRQLNIYGFMRKVNLRNVDPAIDDPDASTWSHPTLNRHSPPEVVANFKRRVPPRLPKPRKRDVPEPQTIPPPRSAIGLTPLTVPSSVSHKVRPLSAGRSRGFSAPSSFTPLSQASAAGWGTSYPRAALPPLTVPPEPHLTHSNSMYGHSPHGLHPVTPAEDSPGSSQFNSLAYNSNREMMVSSSHYSYPDQGSWSSNFPNVSGNATSSGHTGGSLSSLLNPSSGGYPSRPTPSINTSYASPFSSMPMHNEHSASSVSPDSRPTTGYSMSSVSSMPYDDSASHHGHHIHHDYSRPNSSHHRSISPTRPQLSKASYPVNGSLSIRRTRRHSQAMSPYPSPYEHPPDHRPSTSPHPGDSHHHGSIPRVRSMIQLPSVDSYGFNPSHAEFAYSAVPADSMDGTHGWNGHHHANRNQRPSTSASSISAASHTSSSQANTPPVTDTYGGGETDINRFSPDFGFVPMNEHLPPAYPKATEG